MQSALNPFAEEKLGESNSNCCDTRKFDSCGA